MNHRAPAKGFGRGRARAAAVVAAPLKAAAGTIAAHAAAIATAREDRLRPPIRTPCHQRRLLLVDILKPPGMPARRARVDAGGAVAPRRAAVAVWTTAAPYDDAPDDPYADCDRHGGDEPNHGCSLGHGPPEPCAGSV